MSFSRLIHQLSLFVCYGLLVQAPLNALAQTPETVPSYADALADYQARQKPGMLSAQDRATMQASAEKIAAGLPDPGLKAGERAPDFTLPNADGDPVTLYRVLADGPVVLTFYRGAWCPFCNMELKALRDSHAHFERLGARVIAVTPQQPDKSAQQVKTDGYPFQILSDLDSRVMRDYKLHFNVPEALSTLYRDRFGLDLAEFNGEGRYELPVPGTFVIGSDGIIRAAFADTDYKRRMEPRDIVNALRNLRGETLVNDLDMQFVSIPAGTFNMGTGDIEAAFIEHPDGDKAQIRDETPAHRVYFRQPFWMSRTEITQAQWLAVMDTRPGPESHWQRSDWRTLPVVSVTWFDVQRFIDKLQARSPGMRYRLPSEAQWEYAARAGSEGLRPVALEALTDSAWYIDNSGDEVQAVATRKPNAWGLYDMLGNVWEWTADWYAPDYYAQAQALQPQGPAQGGKKVRRGGSYHCPVHLMRTAYRAADDPQTTYSVVGFRLIAEARP